MGRLSSSVIATMIVLIPAHAAEPTKCDNSLFKGNYALSVYGTVWDVPTYPVSGPVARVGRFDARGDGTFSVPSLASYAGVPAAIPSPEGWAVEPAEGAYSIGADCSFTLTVGAPPPLTRPITFEGSITRDGKHLSFIQVDPPGTTVKAQALKISSEPCDWDDVKGEWAVQMRGELMPPIEIPAPPPLGTLHIGLPKIFGDYSMTGRFSLDPPVSFAIGWGWPGKVKGSTVTTYKSVVSKDSWTGTYRVYKDCTVNFWYRTSSPIGDIDLGWWGVIRRDGDIRELHLIGNQLLLGPLVGLAWPQ